VRRQRSEGAGDGGAPLAAAASALRRVPALPLLAVVSPLLLLLGTVQACGVNAAIADELHYVELVRTFRAGGDWVHMLWAQHNEHRVVAMKLLIVAVAKWASWNQKAEMLASVALTALLLVGLWGMHRMSGASSRAVDILAFAPVSFLACSLSQFENQFYGLMVCHYFTASGAIVALWLLARRGIVAVAVALVAAFVAATSVGSGLLVFPAGMIVLAARRSGWARWSAWIASGAITVVLYFRNYVRPPHTTEIEWTAGSLLEIAKLAAGALGAPLAAGSLGWAIALAGAFLAVACVVLLLWLRGPSEERARTAPLAALLLFGLATCGMIAVGRAFLVHPGDPLGSRYITHANLAWFGAYLLLLANARVGRLKPLRTAAWGVLGVGLVAANLHGAVAARAWNKERLLDQYVLQTVTRQPDSVLTRLGPPEIVRPRALYLYRKGLSAAASPQRLLMLLDPTLGTPTAEIRRGQTVVQRLRCTVEELHDAGVLVLPPHRGGAGSVSISVAQGRRVLGRVSFPAAAIAGWTWVAVPIEGSARCPGGELEVRIESRDTPAGTGVMLLMAYPFFGGSLSQGSVPMPEDRALGIALNAFHHDILEP